MNSQRNKSLDNIEEKLKQAEPGSLRRHILETAKDFKLSWIELGRGLYSVWKDKSYKQWGYVTFEAYIAKEIGIRKQTGLKLLRSYSFLEKEEPDYLKQETRQQLETVSLPSYEAIDALRLAKNKKELTPLDYAKLKKEVFESGKDAGEFKKDLTCLIRQRQELDPDEAWEKKKQANLKRMIGVLNSLKQDAELLKLVPAQVLKKISELINMLKEEIE